MQRSRDFISQILSITLFAEPVPVSTVACEFEPDHFCGYSYFGLHAKAYWEFVDIEVVKKLSIHPGNQST